MPRDVRLDRGMLNLKTFASNVGAFEPREQLIFCENTIVQCQIIQGQTMELLIATLDWIEEKNLPQHIGKSTKAYLQILEERYPLIGTVATMRRERRIERAKEDIKKIWKAPLDEILGQLHPPTLNIKLWKACVKSQSSVQTPLKLPWKSNHRLEVASPD
jgi:hypothetical protein